VRIQASAELISRYNKTAMRILVFGDSIAQGMWDPAGGWVQRLWQEYTRSEIDGGFKDDQPVIFNLGVSGDMTQNVVKRLALETAVRKWMTDDLIIIIAVGINDTMVFKNVESNSTELYKGELQQIVAGARQYTEKILFVGLTAVDEKRTTSPDQQYVYTNARIKEFERTLRSFCEENELPIVKIFETLEEKQAEEDLLADGLHPNMTGHELIASLVKPVLDKILHNS
jgi:lysophospholipase L1-like esterase